MNKYEYKMVYARQETFQDYLKEHGDEGWEAYHLNIYKQNASDGYGNYGPTNMYDIYLKRRIDE